MPLNRSRMFQDAVATARVVLERGSPSLSAIVMRGTAAVICGLISPWCANCEEGAQPASLAVDAPRCHNECCFAPSIELGGETLSLRGFSTFRYWGLRVYTGALYAPPSAQSRDAVRGETRKKLVLCYHRSLSPDQFQEKSQEVLEDTPGIELTALEPHLSALNKSYVEVKEGDRYAITYEPSSGTMKLVFNEREPGLVTIQSRSFAKTYFGIWLSEYSVGNQFTAELFGEKVAE
jgi:hypothetical protein